MKPKVINLYWSILILILLIGFQKISAQTISNDIHFKKAISTLSNLLPQNVNLIKLLVGNETYSFVTVVGVPSQINVMENGIEFISTT